MNEEIKKYIDEETLKQVYFYCDNKNPNGIYPAEIDLIEFTEKILQVAGPNIAKAEREACLKIVESLNKEVAQVIRDRRG